MADVKFEDDLTLPCRDESVDPEWFFADSDNPVAVAAAKALCVGCDRRGECLTRALHFRDRFGIFAGYTPAEREAIRERAERAGRRPEPPARYGDPGMAQHGVRADLAQLGRVFAAARAVVGSGLTRREAARRFGVNIGVLSDVSVVVRWAPDVAGDVEEGRMPLASAARYARAVQAWSREQVAA